MIFVKVLLQLSLQLPLILTCCHALFLQSLLPNRHGFSVMRRQQSLQMTTTGYGSKKALAVNLKKIISKAKTVKTTKFASSAWLPHSPSFLTSLRVAGLDRDVAIPISKKDMEDLKRLATKALFGLGPKTITNTTVRDAWQIDGRNVWSESQPSFFQHALQTKMRTSLKEQLGVDTDTVDVQATLYKMLLYEKGGHFLEHRDTEKEPGMFGTYLLQVPVEGGHEGGELIIAHGRKKKVVVDTATESQTGAFQEAMLYADCMHELKEVTNGSRCVLAFNLAWRPKDPDDVVSKEQIIPLKVLTEGPPSEVTARANVVKSIHLFIDRWVEAAAKSDTVPKWLTIPLEHMYSRETLTFDTLKGKDALLAKAMMSVSAEKLGVYLVHEDIGYTITHEWSQGNDGKSFLDLDENEMNEYEWEDEDGDDDEHDDTVDIRIFMIPEKMDEYYLSAKSREGKRFGFSSSGRDGAELHRQLNNIYRHRMLDQYHPDEEKQFVESQELFIEEKSYFNCFLTISPAVWSESMKKFFSP